MSKFRFDDFVMSPVTSIDEIFSPASYLDDINYLWKEEWNMAIEKEIMYLNKNKTWTLAELPVEVNPLSSKWI